MTGEPRPGPSRWFWPGLVVGLPFIVVGVRDLLSSAGVSAPFNFALWFFGGALVHDFVLAPVTLVVAAALRRWVPQRALGTVQWAGALTVLVGAFALIPLVGWGRRPAEPTLQPLDYWLGFGIVVGAIWAAAAATAVVARLRHGRARA